MQLTLDESQAENDTVQEYQEIKVVYSPQLKKYLDDVVIDYVDNIYQRGFTFQAPGLSTC